MWYNHKFFKYGAGILLTLLIIFMLGQIDFFLLPFRKLVAAIFTPILASGILYYILRPLVRLLQKIRISKSIAIVITFIVVIFLFVILSTYTGAIVVEQFNALTTELYNNFDLSKFTTDTFINSKLLESIPLENLEQKVLEMIDSIVKNSSNFFFGLVSTVTNVSTIILMIPFILFYFLKDDGEFSKNLLSHIPKKHTQRAERILKDIDTALSSYIVGQMLVALSIGILMFVGYLIIGMKYPLVLAIFALVTALIPFFGAVIGIIPALFISLTIDPFMVLKVILVMIIVQQVDGNFISPQIMGQRLHVHPVTVILLLMIGVSLYGFVGLLVTIPVYAALKVTIKNVYDIYKVEKLHNSKLKPTDI